MSRLVLLVSSFALAASPAMAQGRSVPPGHRPPAGMCRIWIDGVPPGRQPGIMSCAEARRRVPPNGRVIYGDVASHPGRANGKWRNAAQRDYENCRERERYKNGAYKYELACKRDRDRNDDWDDDDDERWRVVRGDRRTGDVCLDRNRDGRCDIVTRRREACVDRNRDGRCDVATRRREPRGIDDLIDIMRERRGAPR